MSSSEIVMQEHQMTGARHEKRDASEMMIYWRGVAKRKWLILGVSAGLAILAGLAALTITPVYRATATVIIEQNRGRVVAIEEVYSGGGANREHFETQADILASRALAAKVIAKLGLTTHPEFDPRQQKLPMWQTIAQRIGVTSERKAANAQQIEAAVLGSFMQRTIVEPARLSQLIHVSFDSPDAELASQVANAIVETYIESDTETRYGMSRRASEWLQERLLGLKRTLDESERALQDYREREQIVETRGLAQTGAPGHVEDVTRALLEARQKRTQAQIAYEQTKVARDNPESLSGIQRSPMMVRLKDAESDAERKVAELSKRYGPEHVRMIQAQSELRQAREGTQTQIRTIIASLASEYEAARANKRALERSLAEAKAHVQGMNRKEFRLVALERAVAANRQLYETFLNRYKETSTDNGVQSNRVARVTDPAVTPDTPIKPKKRFIVTIVFFLGLVFGMLVAVLRERLDNTLKAPADVEDKLGRPMLAMLPLLRGDSTAHPGRHFVKEPRSSFSEGIRTVRTGVLLSGLSTPQRALLVTSSIANEGKTVVAANLALAHAQTQRVLLVDADLHQPSVAGQLGLDSTKPGLIDLFSGRARFADCLQRVPGSSLHVITAGSTHPDPLEVMLSQRFQQLLKALISASDLVIIDSPPMHLFSDALVLAKSVDGVVFVVKAGSTPHQLARQSLGALDSVDGNVLGVILNQLDFREAERYYGAYTSGYDDYYRKPSKFGPSGRRLPAPGGIITASNIH